MDVQGTLRSENGTGVIRLEARFAHSVDEVWAAITDPAVISRWYGNVSGDLRVGGDFRLDVPVSGWAGGGHVHECDAPRHLVVTTREDDESFETGQGAAPFDDTIDVTLTPDGDATLIVAEFHGLPMDKLQYYGAGWQMHAESLGAMLAGEAQPTENRFDELVPFYEPLAEALRNSA